MAHFFNSTKSCRPSKWTTLCLVCLGVLAAIVGLVGEGRAQEVNRVRSEILLQGFNWESALHPTGNWYSVIGSRADEIAASGFTSLWLPPPSEAVPSPDQPYVPNVVDSRGYMPLRYYNLNSRYGSADDLRRLVDYLKSRDLNPIADIVVNHRGAMNRDFYGRWNVFEGPAWGTWAIVREHRELGGTGAPDTGLVYNVAADLDHTNDIVRRDLSEWMRWLKDEVGFGGWRYDFAKGYSGRFVGHYNSETSPNFSVGEYWTDMKYSCGSYKPCYNQDSHRQEIVNWIDSTWKDSGRGSEFASAAFDFTTKGILQEAVRSGEFWRLRDAESKAPGLIGWWPAKSVTFIDNHDTGSTQQHWAFGSPQQVLQGYAYILTHPGTPSVFWDHFFDWNMKIELQAMMDIRRRNGLSSTSSLRILEARQGLYAAVVDGRVALKLGPEDWSPPRQQRASWKLVLAGENFAIWER